MTIREELYLGNYATREDLEQALKELQAPDATRTQWIGDCARKAEYAIIRGLDQRGESYPKRAGIAIHSGMATYYTAFNVELALQEVRDSWGDLRPPPSGHRYAHLTVEHIEVIMKNYLKWCSTHDMFKPIIVNYGDLDLQHVRGAIWRITEDGRVVLGESKVVMEFQVNGEPFLYSGIPDLPVEMGGAYYIFDHKSTNGYLGEWWAEQYKYSNQLRGYCAMIERLTGLRISGALINGVYMGARATIKDFNGTRFARFGPFMYSPSHYSEAIKNQYYWRKSLDYHTGQGYYPQHTSRLCSGCSFSKLCDASPSMRESIIENDYEESQFSFLNI